MGGGTAISKQEVGNREKDVKLMLRGRGGCRTTEKENNRIILTAGLRSREQGMSAKTEPHASIN